MDIDRAKLNKLLKQPMHYKGGDSSVLSAGKFIECEAATERRSLRRITLRWNREVENSGTSNRVIIVNCSITGRDDTVDSSFQTFRKFG